MPAVETKPVGVSDQGVLRLNRAELLIFSRHLSTMLGAGVPITRALDVLSSSGSELRPALAAREVSRQVHQGMMLSRAASMHPGAFPEVFVSMVRTGEACGGLVESLSHLATWLERDLRMLKRVVSALTYPALVAGMTGLLTLVLALTILPGFLRVYHDMGLSLPWPTRMVVLATSLLGSWWFWLLAAAALGAWLAWLKERLSTLEGRRQLASVLFRVPFLGGLLVQISMARMAASMSLLLEAGSDLLTSLQLVAKASGNPLVEANMPLLLQSLKNGGDLAEYLSEHDEIYPPCMAQLIRVGEESSNLPLMFAHLARLYDNEVDYRLELLSSLLEPIMLALVSLLVGFILIAMLLPLYGILGSL